MSLFGGNLGGECFLEGGDTADCSGGGGELGARGVTGEEFGGGGESVHVCYY